MMDPINERQRRSSESEAEVAFVFSGRSKVLLDSKKNENVRMGNKEKPYYLIPRKKGVFTPFFVISEVRTIGGRVASKTHETTEEFTRLVGLRQNIEINLTGGRKNKLLSVASKIVRNHEKEERVTIGKIEQVFHQNSWEITLG